MSEPRLWTDDYDTYIATDLKHLARVYEDHQGDKFEAIHGWPMEEAYRPIDPATEVRVYWDGIPEGLVSISVVVDDTHPSGDASHLITATAEEWAKWQPAGFLCSTEF